MKKIIIILLLFSGVSYGQKDISRTSPVGSNPSSTSTYNKTSVVDANLKAKLTLYIPNGITPTLNNAKDSTGAVYFATVDSSFNIRLGGDWIKYKTAQAAAAAIANRTVKVFILSGESNAAGVVPNSQLVPSDTATNNIKILNNSNLKIETMHVGVNNAIGINSTNTFGLEVAISKHLSTGDTAYVVKTAYAGATINYLLSNYYTAKQRIDTALYQIRKLGKIPQIYFLYSQGINDGYAGVDTIQWRNFTLRYWSSLRTSTGYNPFFVTKLISQGVYFNQTIGKLSNYDGWAYPISITGATQFQINHWDKAGLDLIYTRMMTAYQGINDYNSLEIAKSGPMQIQVNQSDALINNLTVGEGAGSILGNTVVGYQSLGYSTTTNGNALFGYQSGKNVASNLNSMFGYQSGMVNTSGNQNCFFGGYSGLSNITGSNNSFFGYNAGNLNNADQNTFIGSFSGYNNASGTQNSYLGVATGNNNTTGSGGVYIGYQAGHNNTTANVNTYIGYDAGYSGTTSGYNTFTGAYSGQSNTGDNNAFFGYNSGNANTTGNQGVFIGSSAGLNNTTGNGNVAIGFQSGLSGVTNSGTTYLGYQAGKMATSNLNTFIGYQSGKNTTTGFNNVFMGAYAGSVNTTGSSNNFNGYNSGISNTTGSNNIFIGDASGSDNITGSNNLFLGYHSGVGITTGSNNTMIGSNFGALQPGTSGVVIITDGVGNLRQYISPIGNVVFGSDTTNSPSSKFTVKSITQGSIPFPVMTTAVRDAIASPAGGLHIYNTDTNMDNFYNGTAWVSSLIQTTPPALSTSAGTSGQVAMDANYFYWYAGGRWNRVARDATF